MQFSCASVYGYFLKKRNLTGAEDITTFRTYMVAGFEISEEEIKCDEPGTFRNQCPGNWHEGSTRYTSLKARFRLKLNF